MKYFSHWTLELAIPLHVILFTTNSFDNKQFFFRDHSIEPQGVIKVKIEIFRKPEKI